MTLTLTVGPGEEVCACIKTALRIALLSDVNVEFYFNSFRVYVKPEDSVEAVLQRYTANFKSGVQS